MIVRALAADNADLHKGGRVTVDSIRTHAFRHVAVRIRTFERPHVLFVRTQIFRLRESQRILVGQFRQRLGRACRRAMISARTAERRALPASSRSGLSTNSTVCGTL